MCALNSPGFFIAGAVFQRPALKRCPFLERRTEAAESQPAEFQVLLCFEGQERFLEPAFPGPPEPRIPEGFLKLREGWFLPAAPKFPEG